MRILLLRGRVQGAVLIGETGKSRPLAAVLLLLLKPSPRSSAAFIAILGTAALSLMLQTVIAQFAALPSLAPQGSRKQYLS